MCNEVDMMWNRVTGQRKCGNTITNHERMMATTTSPQMPQAGQPKICTAGNNAHLQELLAPIKKLNCCYTESSYYSFS